MGKKFHNIAPFIVWEARAKMVDDLRPLHLRFFRCRTLRR